MKIRLSTVPIGGQTCVQIVELENKNEDIFELQRFKNPTNANGYFWIVLGLLQGGAFYQLISKGHFSNLGVIYSYADFECPDIDFNAYGRE